MKDSKASTLASVRKWGWIRTCVSSKVGSKATRSFILLQIQEGPSSWGILFVFDKNWSEATVRKGMHFCDSVLKNSGSAGDSCACITATFVFKKQIVWCIAAARYVILYSEPQGRNPLRSCYSLKSQWVSAWLSGVSFRFYSLDTHTRL